MRTATFTVTFQFADAGHFDREALESDLRHTLESSYEASIRTDICPTGPVEIDVTPGVERND